MRAMILAAGRGERMRPLTDNCPKPLLHVQGKPLIEWHIERLVKAGIQEIVINHAWLGEQLPAYLQDGRQWGAKISYSAESTALETAAGISNALHLLGPSPFVVINGDVWTDWDASTALSVATALSEQTPAWLLLAPNPSHHPTGDFGLNHINATYDEVSDEASTRYTFAGIAVYHPVLFKDIPKDTPYKLAPLLRHTINTRQVLGSLHTGTWVDVGTIERLNELNTHSLTDSKVSS